MRDWLRAAGVRFTCRAHEVWKVSKLCAATMRRQCNAVQRHAVNKRKQLKHSLPHVRPHIARPYALLPRLGLPPAARDEVAPVAATGAAAAAAEERARGSAMARACASGSAPHIPPSADAADAAAAASGARVSCAVNHAINFAIFFRSDSFSVMYFKHCRSTTRQGQPTPRLPRTKPPAAHHSVIGNFEHQLLALWAVLHDPSCLRAGSAARAGAQ